jgi:hypothetical protein
MFGIAAVVMFAIATLMYAFSLNSGKVVNYVLFALIGLLCLALDRGYGWYSTRRGGT